MANKAYDYTIYVKDASDKIWTVSGSVDCEFIDVSREATRAAFQKMTQGDAVYGHPGEGSCKGPYTMTGFQVRLRSP